MSWLKKLPNSRAEPSGLEWQLLRRMPRVLLIGTLLPAMVALIARAGTLDPATLQMVNFFAIGVVIVLWTLVLTLSIACFIIMVMKGPVYEADSYPLPDADRPTDRRGF